MTRRLFFSALASVFAFPKRILNTTPKSGITGHHSLIVATRNFYNWGYDPMGIEDMMKSDVGFNPNMKVYL